jgi:hypothetical protein
MVGRVGCTSLKFPRPSWFTKLATVSVGNWWHLKRWARQHGYIFTIRYIELFCNKYIRIIVLRLFIKFSMVHKF